MDPRSEVVLRQIDHLQGRVLFINAPHDALLSQVNGEIWTWNYADHQAQQRDGYTSYFDTNFPQQNFDQVVIFVPKSKELLSYVLHEVATYLPQNADIFLVGEKKGGVERAAKQLQNYGKTCKLDSARHCQMWHARLNTVVQPKALQDWVKTYTLPELSLTICALPGVFSQNHLDIGTAVLLPYLTEVKSGKLADFGCGAGIIGCYLAKLNPKNTIFALDVDAFALKSTQLTFEHNKIDASQLQLCPVTGIQDAPINLNAIISNPPFHQGIHTHYDVSERLCHDAKAHLTPTGELWIVANRFLNYSNLIEQQFGHCTVKADQKGFKVLHANTKYKGL